MKYAYEMITCIVNAGFSDEVMKVAKEQGAKGGTVINAKGTANPDAEKFFNITVQPEKEIVMIVVPSEIKNNLLKELYSKVGLDSPGQGIAFAMPIDKVVGITKDNSISTKTANEETNA